MSAILFQMVHEHQAENIDNNLYSEKLLYRRRLGIDIFENCVFYLSLRSAFTIFTEYRRHLGIANSKTWFRTYLGIRLSLYLQNIGGASA